MQDEYIDANIAMPTFFVVQFELHAWMHVTGRFFSRFGLAKKSAADLVDKQATRMLTRWPFALFQSLTLSCWGKVFSSPFDYSTDCYQLFYHFYIFWINMHSHMLSSSFSLSWFMNRKTDFPKWYNWSLTEKSYSTGEIRAGHLRQGCQKLQNYKWWIWLLRIMIILYWYNIV